TDYGHAGPVLVEAIIRQGTATLANEHAHYVQRLATGNWQQNRAAGQTFALAAVAGELAIRVDVLPWPEGTAIGAASEIFCLWCAARKADNRSGEHAEILYKVLDFINAHGTARFSALHPSIGDSEPIVRDRAGWWEEIEDKDGNTIRVY